MTDVPEGFPMRLPKEALVGLDGLEPDEAPPAKAPGKTPPTPLTLSARAMKIIATAMTPSEATIT